MFTTILHRAELDPWTVDLVTGVVPGELERREGHCRLHHRAPVAADALAELRARVDFDVNPVPEVFRAVRPRLLITDMDSTFINIECVDEIADFAGVKDEVARVTEAAMRGELDFEGSLTERVGLLKGLGVDALGRVYEERLRLNPGAEHMVEGLRAAGVASALVSGGFTFFTDRLKAAYGLDYARANVLEVEGDTLTGHVVGDIVGAEAKRHFLLELCEELGIEPVQAIAMGDGANDLRMMAEAGLSIAYHAKPRVQAEASAALNHSGLDAVLHFLDLED